MLDDMVPTRVRTALTDRFRWNISKRSGEPTGYKHTNGAGTCCRPQTLESSTMRGRVLGFLGCSFKIGINPTHIADSISMHVMCIFNFDARWSRTTEAESADTS
jgi:hypothetical protein